MKKPLVFIAALAACTPQGTVPSSSSLDVVAPAASGKLLAAKPSKVEFALAGLIEPPKTVRVEAAARLPRRLLTDVADPTQVGVSAPVHTSPHTAKVTLYPISSGMRPWSTTVTIRDSDNPRAAVRVLVSQAPCGRPDNITHADLIYPPKGSTVPVTTGSLYFVVYSASAVTKADPVNLHLIVGKHQTLEGSSLVKAPPPPGAVYSTPPPGPIVTTTMRGDVPKLPSRKTITTQVYDDSCQSPLLAGAFTTS